MNNDRGLLSGSITILIGAVIAIMALVRRPWQIWLLLGVDYLIYEQRIWTVQRGGEGWRGMSDRGGDTANHYDHVHVTTVGNAGTL